MTFPGVFFIFFFIHIFIFWAARRVKGQIVAKDDKKKKNLSAAFDISATIYHMIVIYDTLV